MKQILLLCVVLLFSGCSQPKGRESNPLTIPKRLGTFDVVAYVGDSTLDVDIKVRNSVSKSVESIFVAQDPSCFYAPLSQCANASNFLPNSTINKANLLKETPYISVRFSDGQETLPVALAHLPLRSNSTLSKLISFKGNMYFFSAGLSKTTVWKSNSGLSWQKQSSIPTKREGYRINVLGEKIILTGGCDGEFMLPDIWSSTDGKSWRQDKAPYPARCQHATAVFNNKLWLIGGTSSRESGVETNLSDIWSYSQQDGWKKEVANAPFGKLTRFKISVFNGQLVLLSGLSNDANKYANIWLSDDGKIWRKQTHNLPSQGGGSNYSLIESNQELWLYASFSYSGATDYYSPAANQIWHSKDGKNWTLSQYQPSYAQIPTSDIIKYNGKLWLSGWGEKQIWSSNDGLNWQSVGLSNVNQRHSFSAAQVINNKLLLFGRFSGVYKVGNWPHYDDMSINHNLEFFNIKSIESFDNRFWLFDNKAQNYYSSILTSDEGIKWATKSSHANFGNLREYQVASYSDKLFVFGERDAEYNLVNSAWSSSDGLNWTKLSSHVFTTPIEGSQILAFKNKLWLLGGKTGKLSGEVGYIYSSQDGITWKKEPTAQSFTPRYKHSAIIFNNKLWIIGGSKVDTYGEYLNDVWNSEDGVTWNKVTGSTSFPARKTPLVFVHNGYIWLTDKISVDNNASQEIWRSKDGKNWQKVVNTTLSEMIH